MNLDIVLDWMKTYTGKVTPNAIQRKFGIAIWKAWRIYDMLVKHGHVHDENRKEELLAESKREAAEDMYEVLQKLVDWNTKYPAEKEYTNYGQICKIGHLCSEICKEAEDVLKKARGES